MYTITEDEIPNARDGIALYLDAGWGTAADYVGAEQVFETAYRNSHFVTAKDGQHLVGMIRYLTDGAHDTQIVECVVLSSHRNQGVAKAMLDKLKERYPTTDIYIQSTEKCQDFFLREGFKKHRLIGLSYSK